MNREARILLIASNLWFFAEGMFGPLLAVFTQRVGGDLLEVSWAWAIFLVVQGVLAIFIGRIFDGFEQERTKQIFLVCGYILNTIFTFGYLLVFNSASLFVVEAGLGVAAALATPTWDSLFTLHTKRKESGVAWGLEDGLSKITTGVAIVIGGLIVTASSFTLLFTLMGFLQILATVVQARLLFMGRRHAS